MAHRPYPLDGGDHLRRELTTDVLGAGAHLAGDVGDHGHLRVSQRRAVDDLGQPRGRLLHQRRVRRDADAQGHNRPCAGFADQLDGPVERGKFARDDELLGRIGVRHADDAAGFAGRLLASLLEALPLEANDGRHAARSVIALLLHQPSALADEPQRVAELQRAGRDQRRVLAQAVAGHEARRLPLLAHRLEPFAHRGQTGQ